MNQKKSAALARKTPVELKAEAADLKRSGQALKRQMQAAIDRVKKEKLSRSLNDNRYDA